MFQLTSELNIQNNSELKIQSITIDSLKIFTYQDGKGSYPEFYCFEGEESVTDVNNLNFNNLKKCSTCCTNKKQNFLVLKLEEKHMDGFSSNNVSTRLPATWQKDKKTFNFEFKNSNSDNNVVKFDGKLISILHVGYTPTVNSSK